MDELIGMLSSKIGLSADQAKGAVAVVMGFMKDKLPADVMNQLTTAMPDLGNMLGDAAGTAKDAAGSAAGAAAGAVGSVGNAASGAAGAATDAGGGLMDSIKKTIGG
jgi:hypothetical protein